MENLKYFENQMRARRKPAPSKKIAITYTRISSEGQSNFSLDYQEKLVVEHCKTNGYELIERFGGTHESAKTDDRKELKRALDFVTKRRRSASPITHLVVAYTDRISRSDENIALYNRLTSMGLKVESAAEGALPEGVHGEFMQKMKLLYANYENNLRKEKCVKGIKEKILRGEVVGSVPMGYDLYGPRVVDENRIQKRQEIKVNKDGELLRLAWKWKAQGHSDSTILRKLKAMGMRNIYKQKLSAMWKKSFYCGVIVNRFVEEPVQGNWEPLVTVNDFVKINEAKPKKEICEADPTPTVSQMVQRPLQGFIYCPKCGRKFTGYETKKTGTHYYKCNTTGCGGGNVNTETTPRAWKSGAHDLFIDYLKQFSLTPQLRPTFKALLEAMFSDMNKEADEERKLLKSQLFQLEEKKSSATDLYIEGKLREDIYETKIDSIEKEILTVEEKLNTLDADLSNLLEQVPKVVKTLSELPKLWYNSTFEDKQIIQRTLFPKGIQYDKPNHSYRTLKTNAVIREILSLKKTRGDIKEKDSPELTEKSCLVAGIGLEPMTFGL